LSTASAPATTSSTRSPAACSSHASAPSCSYSGVASITVARVTSTACGDGLGTAFARRRWGSSERRGASRPLITTISRTSSPAKRRTG
jgi:hypothetical protein